MFVGGDSVKQLGLAVPTFGLGRPPTILWLVARSGMLDSWGSKHGRRGFLSLKLAVPDLICQRWLVFFGCKDCNLQHVLLFCIKLLGNCNCRKLGDCDSEVPVFCQML